MHFACILYSFLSCCGLVFLKSYTCQYMWN
jgi:hypothetical protein